MTDEDTLTHYTKALILLITVAATELGSNGGLYLAMVVWLELDFAIKLEKGILEYFKGRSE